jgi:hypothetical protein
MSYQPRASQPSHAAMFKRDEWELLVTLPRRVLVTAATTEPPEARGAAEGIAGIEAIASGLASPSPLVREVVGSIYSESHSEPQELLGDRDGDAVLQTLSACRYAAELLAGKSSPDDAEAYREWLCHIAAVTTGVARGMTGQGITPPPQATEGQSEPAPAGRVGLLESRFLYALSGVLRP